MTTRRTTPAETPVTSWGQDLALDIHDCSSSQIADPLAIAAFAKDLCRLIEMKAYGEPQLIHFGNTQDGTLGYTLVQLLETSSLVVHFVEPTNRLFLNLTSCHQFDAGTVEDFVVATFGGEIANRRSYERA
jgi:hypothetical protein